jgi:hypothetical protein
LLHPEKVFCAASTARPTSSALLSSISLFDGLMITETDGLPASASRLL